MLVEQRYGTSFPSPRTNALFECRVIELTLEFELTCEYLYLSGRGMESITICSISLRWVG